MDGEARRGAGGMFMRGFTFISILLLLCSVTTAQEDQPLSERLPMQGAFGIGYGSPLPVAYVCSHECL